MEMEKTEQSHDLRASLTMGRRYWRNLSHDATPRDGSHFLTEQDTAIATRVKSSPPNTSPPPPPLQWLPVTETAIFLILYCTVGRKFSRKKKKKKRTMFN